MRTIWGLGAEKFEESASLLAGTHFTHEPKKSEKKSRQLPRRDPSILDKTDESHP
jgi:hypothetical protein